MLTRICEWIVSQGTAADRARSARIWAAADLSVAEVASRTFHRSGLDPGLYPTTATSRFQDTQQESAEADLVQDGWR